MTHAEIDDCEAKLRNLMSQRQGDVGYQNGVEEGLRELALKVGASMRVLRDHLGRVTDTQATIPELAHNIHQALQTWSMIDACRTAAKSHRTAVAAAIIAVFAAFAAVAAAIANWLSALKG
jgi:hypothetical protein